MQNNKAYYYYKDYHCLWRLDFPEEERGKIIQVYLSFPQIWVTKEPLKEDTVKSLELFQIQESEVPDDAKPVIDQ